MNREEQLEEQINQIALDTKEATAMLDAVNNPYVLRHADPDIMGKAGWVKYEHLIELVQSLKDYTRESHNILGFDERSASEIVDMYFENNLPKP